MTKIYLRIKQAPVHLIGALFLLMSLMINQGCAVIAGGSKYYAHVAVDEHPKAAIKYKGITRGYGNTTFKVPRKDANNLVITVSEPGCPTIQRRYNERVFRGWAFVGTVATWTGLLSINGGAWIPIPFGVIVDGAAGAWWKPDANEEGITKTDYNNYNYNIIYEECDKPGSQESETTKLTKLVMKTVLDRE